MIGKDDMQVTRVLFCGPHCPDSFNFTREYLQPYPLIQVDGVHQRDVPEVIENYHICVVMLMRMDSNVISRASKMKLFMQYGVGLEGVDIDAATKHGIKVARIPSAVQSRLLGQPTGDTLLGKTVFILGYGNIGKELAKRLKPFGTRVIATKRSWPASTIDSDSGLVDEKGSHEDICGKSRYSRCLFEIEQRNGGSREQEVHEFNEKGALLVNVSRGGLINYESAYQNLESGHLGGLGIDVACSELLDPNDPILKFKNVIITPHVAGVTEYSYSFMAKVDYPKGRCTLLL